MEREVGPVRKEVGPERVEVQVRMAESAGSSGPRAGRKQIEVTTAQLRLCPLAISP